MMPLRTVCILGTGGLCWAVLRAAARALPHVRLVEAGDPGQVSPAAGFSPDVIVIASTLAGRSTLPLIPRLRAGCPDAMIVVFAAQFDAAWTEALTTLRDLHVSSYLLGEHLTAAALSHILAALLEAPDLWVGSGPVAEAYFAAEEQRRHPAAGRIALTRREQDVLSLFVGEELSEKEIGHRLGIARTTVESHVRNLYQKLGVAGPRQLGYRAHELGLVTELPSPSPDSEH